MRLEMTEEQKRELEVRKYEIEKRHIHKVWNYEQLNSDYFEEKNHKYFDKSISEEERIENEYLEMYEIDIDEDQYEEGDM